MQHPARTLVDRRFLVVLTVLAIATRLVWVLVIHPPGDYVFSDMRNYLGRAHRLVTEGFEPGSRELAWQTWGTHVILAVPLGLFGEDDLGAAAVVWGGMGAAAVVLAYLLACRVCTHRITAMAVGIAVLLWLPNLSNTGYFLSETPFLCFQLWSTHALVRVLADGRGSITAGLTGAVAFAVRPQTALFYVFALVTWIVARSRLPHVRARHLLVVALPILFTFGFSLWRFHAHTGYWAGIAENANMNLTAGRCHNVVTQAFASEALKRRSEAKGDTRDGRRVSLPSFRMLARKLPDEHPFGLRPAFGSPTIRLVGTIGDPAVHREVRRECYRRTGVLGQLRYSLVNASLLWFVGHQWPEMERGRETFLPFVEFYKYVFQVLVWLPSLVGVGLGVAAIVRRPGLALVAWQIVTAIVIASIFFGDIRLRTPYDPYAILLAAEVFTLAFLSVRTWRRRLAST